MDKWFKDILSDKDPYHNRGRDQMRKKGGSGIRVPVAINRRVNNKFVYNECVFIYHFTSLLYYHSTTRYNFVQLKATHKISPLEELVGGRSPT